MKIEAWDEDKVLFSDGSYITYHHEADCCEYNYADFSVLDIFYKGQEFKDYSIEFVKYGFVLILEGLPYSESRVYIPFYSSQNGYYSTTCDLVIHGKESVKIAGNDGYMHDLVSYKKKTSWDSLEGTFLVGVQCLGCASEWIFYNGKTAKEWIKSHMANNHQGKTVTVSEIYGKKSKLLIGYTLEID